MQLKSHRGVQQDEVWAAADSLIADGLRPTIERVRLRIGRGSPNTVSPMLETWFATLGPRLGVSVGARETDNQLPTAVQQAMRKLWDAALLQAQEAASQGFAQVNEALTAARVKLEERETELARRDLMLRERELAMSEALTLTKNQLTQTALQIRELQSAAALREQVLTQAQNALTETQRQRETDRRHFDQQAGGQADAMHRLEARAISNENRLMVEIDGTRHELKKAMAAQNDLRRRIESLNTEKEKTIQTLREKCHTSEMEAVGLHEKLALQDIRLGELQELLQQQRVAANATIQRVGRFPARLNSKAKSLSPIKRGGATRKN
jgi:DNA repair exonuclease SbcCD ATPase subunit